MKTEVYEGKIEFWGENFSVDRASGPQDLLVFHNSAGWCKAKINDKEEHGSYVLSGSIRGTGIVDVYFDGCDPVPLQTDSDSFSKFSVTLSYEKEPSIFLKMNPILLSGTVTLRDLNLNKVPEIPEEQVSVATSKFKMYVNSSSPEVLKDLSVLLGNFAEERSIKIALVSEAMDQELEDIKMMAMFRGVMKGMLAGGF